MSKITQAQYKAKLIQLIQINKSKAFSDDEERKEFMQSRFNVTSLKDMSIDDLKLLLDFCYGKVNDIPIKRATEAQLYKLSKLWGAKARDKSFSAFLNFISKIAMRKLETAKTLTKHEATKVIVALEKLT